MKYINSSLVSIITPCYNASAFIVQTIESVLSQTYKKWELLIIDDCSTDNSADIIMRYVKKDNRIKYLKTEKKSGSPAMPRNVGLKYAQGDYIAFLDADDVWLPKKLEEQLLFMESKGYDFIYSDYEKIAIDGTRLGRVVRGRMISTYSNTLESNDIPCLTVLIKKKLIDEISFNFYPPAKEDFVVWLKIMKANTIAYNTGKVHALYRQSNSTLSADKLVMFKRQWYVLRKVEKLRLLSAIYFIFTYSFKGFLKYIK